MVLPSSFMCRSFFFFFETEKSLRALIRDLYVYPLYVHYACWHFPVLLLYLCVRVCLFVREQGSSWFRNN